MQFADNLKKTISEVNDKNFEIISLQVFEYQFETCQVYNKFCKSLRKTPKNVKSLSQIPFLPVEFFKNHAIKSGEWKEEKIFKSSGTTKTGRSQHFVKDLDFYRSTSAKSFERVYGPLKNIQLLALLPSYQEQGDSSLIEMVDHFLKSTLPDSGYILTQKRMDLEKALKDSSIRKVLMGVSYSLLDLAETTPHPLENVKIMETGGMKGRRKELTRAELHKTLKEAFDQPSIHSEYGMTELMSQAYGENGHFQFPKWAKVLIRDINDPFSYQKKKTGGINVIDLANVDTCSFIETKDLGRVTADTFEVLGRFDNSDVRGCNLLIQRNI